MSKGSAQALRMVAIIVTIAMLGILDWQTGFELSFFILYFIPIAYAAWHIDRRASVGAALLSGVIWFSANYLPGNPYSSSFYEIWNIVTQVLSYLAIALTISSIRQLLDKERQVSEKLREALSEIKVLESFLPICAECKKIRDKDGEWQELEVYIGHNSNTQFSHGYCPECAKRALEEAGLSHIPYPPKS
jgi:K+-sensing histidine kinase KdpD